MDTHGNSTTFGEPVSLETSARAWALAAICLWGLAVSVASLTGLLRSVPPIGIGALILGWSAVVSAAYFRSASLKALIGRLGLRTITGFQAWRVAAALLFFWLGSRGLLPVEFVQRAAWGDLIAALLGAAFFLWPTRGGYWLTHLFGLADLILAASTAMRLIVAGSVEMQHIASFPVALIPFFGVGLTTASHLMAFDLLLQTKTKGARVN